MADVDPMNILPLEIQSILKRKSSRDPNSRFASKLHILLSYVTQHPDLDEKIGCAWVTDDEFRINKPIFVEIMGIKVNTLNVNLKNLEFKQQKHNKNGWTLWKKDGFTRNSIEITLAPQLPPKPKQFLIPFHLGKVSAIDSERFQEICIQVWKQITNADDNPIPMQTFILNAAQYFRQTEQPLDNAKDVLEAIIAPQGTQPTITFSHFCKFMAMFGPADSVMLKIASLLIVSNQTGNWLNFGPVAAQTGGSFDDNEPNRLVLRFPIEAGINNIGMPITKSVWNLPLVDTKYNYICDEAGQTYQSWEHYFKVNPVNFNFNNY